MDETPSPKCIALLLPDLRGGGVELNWLRLAEEFLARGYTVEFVLRQARGEWLDAVPPEIGVHSLDAPRARQTLRPLVRYLRAHQPRTLLVAWWPLTSIAVLATKVARARTRVVVSDHSILSQSTAGRAGWPRFAMGKSMRLTYPRAAARVAVSDDVANDLTGLSGLPRESFDVIGNPVTPLPAQGEVDASLAAKWLQSNGPRIISVGTLKKVKDHDLLLRAFARCRKTYPEAQLMILGDGDEQSALEKLAVELGIENDLTLPGFVHNPHAYTAKADLFALSSRSEGFGNVLVEAMAVGVPVVSTDCPGGPRTILKDGTLGKLSPVGDEQAFAAAIMESLTATHDTEALINRSNEFSVSAAADRYLELLMKPTVETRGTLCQR